MIDEPKSKLFFKILKVLAPENKGFRKIFKKIEIDGKIEKELVSYKTITMKELHKEIYYDVKNDIVTIFNYVSEFVGYGYEKKTIKKEYKVVKEDGKTSLQPLA